MLKKISSTIGVKAITAIFAFLTLIITARILGTEGRGIIGLFMATVSFAIMFNYLIGGSTLVYLSSRHPNNTLIWSSYIWAVFSNALAFVIISLSNSSIAEYANHIFVISLLTSLFQINLNMLLGRENVLKYNLYSLLMVSLNFLLICLLFLILEWHSIESFIYSLYVSLAVCFILSLFALKGSLDLKFDKNLWITGVTAMSFGFISQLANISQLLNLRLSFYLIEYYTFTENVGVYSTGTTLTESIWMIAGSMALVQYAIVSNSRDRRESMEMSAKMARVSLILTLMALIPLLILPESFYTYIFGEGFRGIKNVIYALSPGVLSIGFSMAFSHYFAGVGNYKINAICSGSGLLVTLVCSLLMIPLWGIVGAGIASSIAYLFISFLLIVFFIKDTKISIGLLIPSTRDFEALSVLKNKLLSFTRPPHH
ncbi:MAG: polysaccharide biosynthesis C-terminal domain-containing protein [Bacteroidetes bacterium]|nr:polysaccharide biosynthesis C-terminal domain-containing protein [Bacteroidota bacterium]HET6243565.1 polysaccharide biosynthesis C-terminal domain-containing protein [Bacteroidia bacterium]